MYKNIFFLLLFCMSACSLSAMEDASTSTCSQGNSPFKLLSNEVNYHILSYLLGSDNFNVLIALALTDKQWNELINSPYFTLLVINELGKEKNIVNKRHIVQLLGTAGAKEWLANNPYDMTLNSDLIGAAHEGDASRVQELLEKGAPVDGDGGLNPLFEACEFFKPYTPHVLLRNGAQVDGSHKGQDTPLIRAVLNGNEYIVGLLVRAGADLNKTGVTVRTMGKTALELAIEDNNSEIIEMLAGLIQKKEQKESVT